MIFEIITRHYYYIYITFIHCCFTISACIFKNIRIYFPTNHYFMMWYLRNHTVADECANPGVAGGCGLGGWDYVYSRS